MSLDNLPINAFDFVLVLALIAGVFRGRKHGMSEELLLLVKWLLILFGCAMIYEPAGKIVAQTGFFGLLGAYLLVYVAAGLVVLGMFALVKHSLGGKLLGSDIFGRSEYYLGMVSGFVRFACQRSGYLKEIRRC